MDKKCVPGQKEKDNPAPCRYVSLQKRYAVYKDDFGRTQFLLIPTDRISGIESPQLLAAETGNYWQYAWDTRKYIFDIIGHVFPRDDIAMAVNSSVGRSQNQLHIHIDCLRPEVRDALHVHSAEITANWKKLSFPLHGKTYTARRIYSPALETVNPFLLLAESSTPYGQDMGKKTLAVIGFTFPDGKEGFIVLYDTVNILVGNFASSEELMDHECKIARQ